MSRTASPSRGTASPLPSSRARSTQPTDQPGTPVPANSSTIRSKPSCSPTRTSVSTRSHSPELSANWRRRVRRGTAGSPSVGSAVGLVVEVVVGSLVGLSVVGCRCGAVGGGALRGGLLRGGGAGRVGVARVVAPRPARAQEKWHGGRAQQRGRGSSHRRPSPSVGPMVGACPPASGLPQRRGTVCSSADPVTTRPSISSSEVYSSRSVGISKGAYPAPSTS